MKLTNGWRWNLRVVLYLYKYNIQIVVVKLPISFVVYLNPIKTVYFKKGQEF